jgi:nucleoside-diphosphate-sugar epimerase
LRILVTGHRGFIGRHLVRELKNGGHELHGVDLSEGWDLTVPGQIGTALDRVKPDVVVHLAAQVGRVFGERDVAHTIDANARMTTLLAQAAGERDVQVLYASSSEVYGDRGEHICRESDALGTLPHNLYGLTKRWGEEALQLYAPERLQIVRLSMPYGPGAPPGEGRRALDNILWQATHGKPIPIHRGAERSWCWIDDTVRGIRLVLEQGRHGRHGIYNVGRDDATITMLQLAEDCCALAGADQELVELVDPPLAQTVVKRLSTDKLRGLGWTPGVELEEGLPQVLDWVQQFGPDGEPLTDMAREAVE